MVTIYERNYNAMEKLGILKVGTYAKLQSEGFMDLTVEKISEEVISLAHYGEQNGDLMSDPEMEIKIYPDSRMVEALTIRMDYTGYSASVYPAPGKVDLYQKKDMNQFLAIWLRNLKQQGFKN